MCVKIDLQPRKKTNLFYRYGYVLLMLACMILATIQPHIGGTNGNHFSINTSVEKTKLCMYTKRVFSIFLLCRGN